MTNPFTRVTLALLFVTAISPSPVSAQTDNEAYPTIEVHGRTIKRDGGISTTAMGDSRLVPGSPVTWFVTAGSSNPSAMTVCGGGVSETRSLEELLARNSFVWQMKIVPTKYEKGAGTFDLEWARYQADGAGRPSASGKATLTLREGERQPVDFVHGLPASCQAEAAMVEVAIGMRENRRFAQAILQYDMWLTHRPASGEPLVRRFVAMGSHGTDVAFTFVPLRFLVPQLAPDQPQYDVIVSVLGTIKGRLQTDGRIALTLDTTRRDGLGPRGDAPLANGGNGGRKFLEVAPGEAVEIELPAGSGRMGLPAKVGVTPPPRLRQQGPLAEAISITNGRVMVENGLFFQGQRTSLIVKVRPISQ